MFLYSDKNFFRQMLLAFLLLLGGSTSSIAQSTTYWWNDAVFYEVFVRSFKDSDGDGKGDLKGLMDKLDYLNDGDPSTQSDLGVTGIWLMPIQQSPSYHGYDVTDYRTVEQDYGTNQEFKNFIDSAHARGIKVIIDYVMNHTSSQHPWFVDASSGPTANKRNWYNWQSTNPGNNGPWGQTVWHARNGSYNYGIFWSEMPDLNYNTPEVKDEMFDIAEFWLQDMKVDGFRLDAVKYIFETGSTLEDTPETIDFWQDFRASYKSVKPDAFAVGEAWTSTDKVIPYVENDGLDFCFEFDLATAIISTANYGTTTALTEQIDEVMTTYPFLQFGTFLTNHDMNRVMYQLGQSTPKAKLAASLLLTFPGVPYLYYGEEIGMTGAGADENKRTPLQWNSSAKAGFTTGTPWRPVNSDYTTKNIESQQIEAGSLWNHYRKLITIRNHQPALRKGDYKAISSATATAFSFLRQYQDENIIVVSNTGDVDLTNVSLNLADGITPGNYVLVELLGGNQISLVINAGGGFSNLMIPAIPAKTTFIYKLLDAAEIATTVTFQVDMNAMIDAGDFLTGTESVDIIADFNNFGVASTTVLTDANADGIYSVTVSNLDIGSKINYKFRINATNDGREEFAGSAYLREYFVLEEEDTVTATYRQQLLTSVASPVHYEVAVYPVPTAKEIFLEFSQSYTGSIQYHIEDLLGVEKISSSFVTTDSSGQQSISCEGLSSGVYLLTLAYNGTRETFRIVVQK